MARAHGQVRRSQVITTWGPGSLIDLPRHSGIVAGLDTWPKADKLEQVIEPRLTRKITLLTGVPNPPLYAPPPDTAAPGEPQLSDRRLPIPGMDGGPGGRQDRRRWRPLPPTGAPQRRSTRRAASTGKQVVPTRFVRACPRGHIEDLDWRGYVHEHGDTCNRQLWLARARHRRRPRRPARALRVRAQSRPARGGRPRPQGARQLPRPAALARGGRARAVRTAEPTADPDRGERATSRRC